MSKFDKSSFAKLVTGITQMSEMLEEVLLVTDTEGLVLSANMAALELLTCPSAACARPLINQVARLNYKI